MPNNTHRDMVLHDIERVAIAYALLAAPKGVDPIMWLANGGPEVDAAIARFRPAASAALVEKLAEACEALA